LTRSTSDWSIVAAPDADSLTSVRPVMTALVRDDAVSKMPSNAFEIVSVRT
jgi:hypothetical protein